MAHQQDRNPEDQSEEPPTFSSPGSDTPAQPATSQGHPHKTAPTTWESAETTPTLPTPHAKMNEASDQPPSHEESVVFENNSSHDDGHPYLHPETPEMETTSHAQADEQAEGEEDEAAAADKEDTRHEESMELLQQLREDVDKANQHSSQLQTKLAKHLRIKAAHHASRRVEKHNTQQLQEYDRCIKILTELKQQLTADSEKAQQQAKELRLQSQEKLDKVGTQNHITRLHTATNPPLDICME